MDKLKITSAILTILIGFNSNSFCQEVRLKKNSITINTAYSNLLDRNLYTYRPSLFNITTFSYERMITNRLSASLSYGQWFMVHRQIAGDRVLYKHYRKLTEWTDDVIWDRHSYNFTDLTISYMLYQLKAFRLKGCIGPSLAWGINRYLNEAWINPEPPHNSLFFTSEKKETYGGIIAGVSCSYSFWKERIRTGIFITGRHYPSPIINITQLDFGIQLGYNF